MQDLDLRAHSGQPAGTGWEQEMRKVETGQQILFSINFAGKGREIIGWGEAGSRPSKGSSLSFFKIDDKRQYVHIMRHP